MELDLWEARFASRGGTYYFTLRGGNIVPVSHLGKITEHHSTARGLRVRYVVELMDDDNILEIEVGSARSTRKGQRGYLHIEMALARELHGKRQEDWHTVLKPAPQEVVNLVLSSTETATWMKKRIQTWGVWR